MEKIRVAKPADAAELLAIYAPYVTETAITFEYTLPTLAEFQQRIADTLIRYPYLVAEDEMGKIVGYAYAGTYKSRAAYDWTVEVTVYVCQTIRAKGIGSALYQALETQLERQGVVQATACVTGGNEQSIAFHEKRGYQLVATFPKVGYKFDQWYDIVWLQKTLNAPQKQQVSFVPFSKFEE
ncbi:MULTISPECIES: GNAT family N-acetyltransferase [Enterococcus]|uniref:GNAT family N-acetyltransferase n=1 Tax=Enterococcus TaxID=1350 RepID=UPI00065E0D6E|nr:MULTISPECIES: GNAT family N-acetyltransferase [Enterococcus]KAF1301315.1 acetyltransferase [Enterococcus sp. JM9B]